MQRVKKSGITALALLLAVILGVSPLWQAFADGEAEGNRTITGKAAAFSIKGPNLHYDCIVEIEIDADGKIVAIRDAGTLDSINENIAKSEPMVAGILEQNIDHWNTFVAANGLDKFIGLTLDQIDVDNHEVDTVSGATSTSWTMKKAIVNAFASIDEDANAPEVKEYLKNAELRKPQTEQKLPVIGGVFNPEVKVLESEGKATYTIAFKTVEMMGITEDIEEIKVEQSAGDGEFKTVQAVVVDGEYKNQFTFERAAVGEEKIAVKVASKTMGEEFDGCIVFVDDAAEEEEPEVDKDVELAKLIADVALNAANAVAFDDSKLVYTKGQSQGASFKYDDKINLELFSKVEVDGADLEDAHYRLDGEKMALELDKNCLNNLSAGLHTVKLQTKDGYATAEFEVMNRAVGTAVKTLSGRAATRTIKGTNLQYDCIIDIDVDANGRIVKVRDAGTLDSINENIAKSEPLIAGILKQNLHHWDIFLNDEGFDKFIGLTVAQIEVDNHEVDTVSGATATSWTMKKAIVNAFDTEIVYEDDDDDDYVDMRDADGIDDEEAVAEQSSSEAAAETTEATENQQASAEAEATYVEKVFVDTRGHWAEQSISYLANRGIVNGVSATRFEPDGNIKKVELLQILANMADVDLASIGYVPYNDVAPDAWYANAVAWAVKNGIAHGVSEDVFDAEVYLTRENMAVIIDNYFAEVAGDALDSKVEKINFVDTAKISPYAQFSVQRLQRAGIISGIAAADNSYSFAPQALATRAQVAKMLADYLQAAE